MNEIHNAFEGIFEMHKLEREIAYKSITAEFEGLTLEEKVDKLIEMYARDRVYGR